MNSSLTMSTTLWMSNSVGSNQGYVKVYWRTMWITKITILSKHLIVSSTNQENGKHPPITYNGDDLFVASPMNHPHADHHHVTPRPRRPPKFINCPNGTLFCVLSHNNSQKILDTLRKDLENMLLLQGQFCSKRLWQMSKVFTHNTREQALLQGPKTLHL